MTQESLRDRLSIFLLCGQLAIPVLVWILYLSDGFDKTEFTQISEIVVPMTAGFGGFALTHIVQSRATKRKSSKQLRPLFVATAVGLPILFLAAVAGAVLLKAFNLGLRSFDDLKLALAALNALSGAASGTVLAALYGKE
jgi:hypothetical protein